ncbi:MAG TPA: zf-HC2 domain-containing protein [Gemmatimonadaceae bacterium]|nr:zf-HC2 domain-containing protein [Gemmatimonadaceae bacterium]
MIDCEEAMRQLWDYLDDELTEQKMAAIREHLAVCQQCYPQFDFERAFLGAIASARCNQRASGALRMRIRAMLREVGSAEA